MTKQSAGPAPKQAQQAGPGAYFGVPQLGTASRLIKDDANESLGLKGSATAMAPGADVKIDFTTLDQFDIVAGLKLIMTTSGTWTEGMGETLTLSPFFPATIVRNVSLKLQAAYSTINLTGPLHAIAQAFRPMWGGNQLAQLAPEPLCETVRTPTALTGSTPVVSGTEYTLDTVIDMPMGQWFDEYYELDLAGRPVGAPIYDTFVSPTFMAAEARKVTPAVTLAGALGITDGLDSPLVASPEDTTSLFSGGTFTASLYRDAWWMSGNPAANPRTHPWLYSRDMITTPTKGQAVVKNLIQDTNTGVGQVLSLWGFVWDPQANQGLGGIVPFSSIERFELVKGGSLQTFDIVPKLLSNRMNTLYGGTIQSNFPDGVFVVDFAKNPQGGRISNSGAVNTYVINGVTLNIHFKAGYAPSATSTCYMGVEALKIVTS